jgi:hypothetical protein
MVQFWLDYLPDLFNTQNLTFLNNEPKTENYTKVLNLVSMIAIISGISFTFVKKDSLYFAITVLVLSLCILINSNKLSKFSNLKPDKLSNFTSVDKISNAYDKGVRLVNHVIYDPNKLNNMLYVNSISGFNKGDIIALSIEGTILETNIVSSTTYTIHPTKNGDTIPVIFLLNNIKRNYPKGTAVLKVSDTSPNIVQPPDGNMSIDSVNYPQGTSNHQTLELQNFPRSSLPNGNRYDWNLELATSGVNGMSTTYENQGQPYGDLKCRESSLNNPMGVIEVPEYGAMPTMYGTCNESELNSNGKENNYMMTDNQEGTVVKRVNDLLFHRGNSQSHYSPVPIDTLPNDQEAFAHFLYRSPTNLINPKYGSIFVNEPEKLKLVSRLARATGTENGGG